VDTLYSQNSPGWCASGQARDAGHHVGQRFAGEDAALLVKFIHRRAAEEAVGKPGSVAQQILHGHRPLGRGLLRTHRYFLEFGEILRHWRADIELAFFRQDHDGDRRDRLRHRRDAEDGIALHERRRLALLKSDGVQMGDFPVTRDQQHGPRNPSARDVRLHLPAHPVEPLRRYADGLRLARDRERLTERRARQQNAQRQA